MPGCAGGRGGERRRTLRGQAAVRRVGLRSRGRRHGDETGQRFLPLRQRHLAGPHAHSARQARGQPAPGHDRPHRAAPAPAHGSGRGETRAGRYARGQGRRVLRLLHGRAAHRGAGRQGHRAAAGSSAQGDHARRAGWPHGPHQHRLRRRAVQPGVRRRPQGQPPLRRLRHAGRPGPARPRLLPQARVRPAEGRLPGLRRAAAHAGRLAAARSGGQGRGGLRNPGRAGQLGQGRAARSRRHVQPDERGGTGETRARLRLEKLPRRRAAGRAQAHRGRREVRVSQADGDLREDAGGHPAGMAGCARSRQCRLLPVQAVPGRLLPDARQDAVGPAAAGSALEARGACGGRRRLRRGRAAGVLRQPGLGRGPALHGAVLSRIVQGQDRGAGGQPQGGLSRAHRKARLDGPQDARGSAAQARHLHH